MDLNDVLRHAVAAGRQRRLPEGWAPVLRVDGELTSAAELGALGDAELEATLNQVTVTAPSHGRLFDESGDLGLAYSAPGLPRFRSAGDSCRGGRLP